MPPSPHFVSPCQTFCIDGISARSAASYGEQREATIAVTVYAIGDVQGCYDELRALLDRIAFDAESDELWFTGDLVNRGPHSLEVLRFVKGLGARSISVLGNHDLHLLALAQRRRPARRSDTLGPVLAAADRDEILDWLRRLPLVHHDNALDTTLIHAGLAPQWDLEQAVHCAREVESVLRSEGFAELFDHMYGDTPTRWSDRLTKWERLRFTINCLTRLRYCGRDGRLNLQEKGPPGSQAVGLVPWFEVPDRRSQGHPIIFGHWSTLRLSPALMAGHRVYPLDTGCCWGGELTALRLSDWQLFSVAATNHSSRNKGIRE